MEKRTSDQREFKNLKNLRIGAIDGYSYPDSLNNLDLINDTYLNLRKLAVLRVDAVIDDRFVLEHTIRRKNSNLDTDVMILNT